MATTTAVAAPVAAATASVKKAPKQFPAPNSDFYDVYETLNAEELATVKRVRTFVVAKVAPVDRKSTRLNSSHRSLSRMPSSA